ncbi:hypothetical protein Trydic_g8701 [Trypoxylus dichotomus]
MCGLPKIQMSSKGSPARAFARYLAHQLKPYGEHMTSYIKNADHFIDILRQQHVENTDILVSFDITSLFTQVPITETVDKHQVEDHLLNLIEPEKRLLHIQRPEV